MFNTNISARYNADTDWVQLYYDGIWNDWKRAFLQPTYYYDKGNEYADITGGWDHELYGTISKTSEYVELKCSNQGNRVAISHTIAVTIPQGAIKLCIFFKKLSMNAGTGAVIGHSIFQNKPSLGTNVPICSKNTPPGTYENFLIEIDLPEDIPRKGLVGYVCPVETAATGAGKTIVAQISSIWYI